MSLLNYVISYQSTRSSEAFIHLYEAVHGQTSNPVDRIMNRFGLDEHIARQVVDDKLMQVIEKFDGTKGGFLATMNSAINFGAMDEVRRIAREAERTADVYVEDEDGELTEIYEVYEVAPTASTTEDEVRKSLDQRQLVEALLRNADENTLATVSAFQNTDTYRQAAKLAGTCHKTIKARIQRLSREFNESRQGHPHDYFTVPTSFAG